MHQDATPQPPPVLAARVHTLWITAATAALGVAVAFLVIALGRSSSASRPTPRRRTPTRRPDPPSDAPSDPPSDPMGPSGSP